MAFLGRGGSVGGNGGSKGGTTIHIHRPLIRRFYVIPLDNTYVLMQMIATFILLLIGAITFVSTYETNIIDPIANIKSNFINTYLIIIGCLVISNLLISFFSKQENKLLTRLIILFLISIIIMMTFFVIKINLDKTYNYTKFKEISNMQKDLEDNHLKSKIDYSTMTLKTEKDYYITQCINAYRIFKIKTTTILIMHLLLNILLIYQMYKIINMQGKKERVNKDDLILFDEEQNLRY